MKISLAAIFSSLLLLTSATAWAEGEDQVAAPQANAVDESLGYSNDSDQAEHVGKLKIENIRVADRYGSIQEDRVQAMRSELRYVPSGSAEGYNLVASQASQGKYQNVHQDNDMKIPSWKLFSW